MGLQAGNVLPTLVRTLCKEVEKVLFSILVGSKTFPDCPNMRGAGAAFDE